MDGIEGAVEKSESSVVVGVDVVISNKGVVGVDHL